MVSRESLDVLILLGKRIAHSPLDASRMYEYLRGQVHRKSPDLESAVKELCGAGYLSGQIVEHSVYVTLTPEGRKKYEEILQRPMRPLYLRNRFAF